MKINRNIKLSIGIFLEKSNPYVFRYHINYNNFKWKPHQSSLRLTKDFLYNFSLKHSFIVRQRLQYKPIDVEKRYHYRAESNIEI